MIKSSISVTTSFLRFYKSKIVMKNAISKQAEETIRADAEKMNQLVMEYLRVVTETPAEEPKPASQNQQEAAGGAAGERKSSTLQVQAANLPKVPPPSAAGVIPKPV